MWRSTAWGRRSVGPDSAWGRVPGPLGRPAQQPAHIPSHLDVLARVDDKGSDARAPRADVSVTGDPIVRGRVYIDAEESEARRRFAPDHGRVLAHTAREDKGIDAVHGRGHRGGAGTHAVDVDVEGESRPHVFGGPSLEHLAHISSAGKAEESRAPVEGLGELTFGDRFVPLQPQHRAWVDTTRARGHDQALERSETHGGVDRSPAMYGSQRRTRAQVARHDAKLRLRPLEQLAGPPGRVRMREPVKSVAADAVALPPFRRDGVGCRRSRHLRVKGRVETGNRRHAWKQLANGYDR